VADNIAARLGKPVRLIKTGSTAASTSPQASWSCSRTAASTRARRRTSTRPRRKYAALCDVFVMDAFGTAHRAEASTHGVAKYAPVACAGILLTEELDALDKALAKPARPMSPSSAAPRCRPS